MITVRELLAERLKSALDAAGFSDITPEVTPTADARFGDYQANAAMILAKQRRMNPRQVAAEIIQHLARRRHLGHTGNRRSRIHQFPPPPTIPR